MSVNTLHYALPIEFTKKIKDSEGLLEAFYSIYGCGSSLESFFNEIDPEEIEEITEDLEEEDVNALKELISQTNFGESAWTENTFDVHINGISNYLESRGVEDSKKLAASAINGDSEVYELSIYTPNEDARNRITAALKGNADEVFSMYELSGHFSDPQWQEAIKAELNDIIKCYESADEINGKVWIGCL